MALSDRQAIQPADITYTGFSSTGQQQTSNFEIPYGARAFALKPANVGGSATKGLLVPSHISNTTVPGTSTPTLGACVVSILEPGVGGESTRLEEWRDPFNINHDTNRGEWRRHFYGIAVGFGFSQWAGACYYPVGGTWRLLMIVGNAYSDEVAKGFGDPPTTDADVIKPAFFTRPADLSATGDVSAHWPRLRHQTTNAILNGPDVNNATRCVEDSGGSLFNPRHCHGYCLYIEDAEVRTALGVDILISAGPWSRYPTLGYGFTLYGISIAQLGAANEGGPVDCKRLMSFNASKAMNGYNASDNKPPGNLPDPLPLQPDGGGNYVIDISGIARRNEGEAKAANGAGGEIFNGGTKAGGFAVITNTNTLIFAGMHAHGEVWYGDPDGAGGTGNNYNISDLRRQFWYYRLSDFVDVLAGTRSPDAIQPYAYSNPTLGNSGETADKITPQGLVWDEDNSRLIMRNEIDTSNGAFDPQQRLHFYAVTRAGGGGEPGGGGNPGGGGSDDGDVRKPFIPPKGGKGGRHVFGRLQ